MYICVAMYVLIMNYTTGWFNAALYGVYEGECEVRYDHVYIPTYV